MLHDQPQNECQITNDDDVGRTGTSACSDTGLFFVHIPKTGGGTIEDTICARDVRYAGRSAVEAYFNYRGVNRPGSHCLLAEQRLLSVDGLHGARTFSVIRNPYARFVSEANFRRTSLEQMMLICQTAQQADAHDLHAHCRPQVDFVGKRGELVDDIFATEEIDGRLLEYLRFHAANPGLVLTSRSHVSTATHAVEDLTEGQRAWLRSRYAADFALWEETRGAL